MKIKKICILITCVLFSISAGKLTMTKTENLEKATFAGGCFWCMESPFDQIDGVISTTVGYTGGKMPNPKYEDVIKGNTGHLESVEIIYDPNKVDFKDLVDAFWRNIDPTNDFGQFADFGSHYKTAIFYHNNAQKEIAESSKKQLEKSKKFNKPIVTTIKPAVSFYKAEDYHQDYYKKNPIHYNRYKKGSGREAFINKFWKK